MRNEGQEGVKKESITRREEEAERKERRKERRTNGASGAAETIRQDQNLPQK